MIICFRCERHTKQALDMLLDTGEYVDYSEIISVAIANLASIHKLVRSEPSSVVVGQVFPGSNLSLVERGRGDSVDVRPVPDPRPVPPEIPELFCLRSGMSQPQQFPPLPRSDGEEEEWIPLERWVFGQYNRLLPAKASCRALAAMLDDEPDGVPLEIAGSRIATEATLLGDWLWSLDQRHHLARDEMLSTAFPRRHADDAPKSQLRYCHHFVASVDGRGRVHGLLVELKLMNVVWRDDGTVRLLLTEPGWKFAMMPNPVLDHREEHRVEKFSDEERSFLIQHIISNVPKEAFAYKSILRHVSRGLVTPEELDRALKQYRQNSYNGKQPSESFFATQRSGAISRMSDLGLIVRIRSGVHVFYELTDAGHEFMRMVESRSIPLDAVN